MAVGCGGRRSIRDRLAQTSKSDRRHKPEDNDFGRCCRPRDFDLCALRLTCFSGSTRQKRLGRCYFGNENLSSRPRENTGFLRLRISPALSESAETRTGMAMVESQCTVTMLAS